MRLTTYASMAALAAACRSPEAGAPSPAPVEPAVPAPVESPASPPASQPAPKTEKGSRKGKAKTEAAAAEAGELAYVVWCMPGHPSIRIGQVCSADPEMADAMRGRGHARVANPEEVAEAVDAGRVHAF